MLSVPPAFVLSQDQTLYKVVYIRAFTLKYLILFNNACVITLCFLKSFLDFPSYFIKESQGSLLFLFALFNFQDAVFALSESLIIISLSLRFVKYFFKISFQKFFPFVLDRFRAAYILYHFPFSLSSTFFKFLFGNFSLYWLPFQDSFNIISQITLFVNTFSKVFCDNFLSSLFQVLPMLRQQAYSSFTLPKRLVYYITHSLNCQHGFLHNIARLFSCKYVQFHSPNLNFSVIQSPCSFKPRSRLIASLVW